MFNFKNPFARASAEEVTNTLANLMNDAEEKTWEQRSNDIIMDILREQIRELKALLAASDLDILRAAKQREKMISDYSRQNNINLDSKYYLKAAAYVRLDPEYRKNSIKDLIEKMESMTAKTLIDSPETMEIINGVFKTLPRL